MKSRRAILILLLLLALGGGLAWTFWPVDNSAPTANPPTAKPTMPKVADAPKPTPVHIAAVEAPKIAPAPAHDAPEPAQPANQNSGQGSQPSVASFTLASFDSAEINDFGEVNFTSGVPQQLTMNDGTPVTVTATLGNNGDVSLRVEVTETAPNGGTSHMTMLTGTQQGKTMILGGPRGMSRIKITLRVN